jgi:hypothetical protein
MSDAIGFRKKKTKKKKCTEIKENKKYEATSGVFSRGGGGVNNFAANSY